MWKEFNNEVARLFYGKKNIRNLEMSEMAKNNYSLSVKRTRYVCYKL